MTSISNSGCNSSRALIVKPLENEEKEPTTISSPNLRERTNTLINYRLGRSDNRRIVSSSEETPSLKKSPSTVPTDESLRTTRTFQRVHHLRYRI